MCVLFVLYMFFFIKQKTAYEMLISDWSSDVCSSDLFRGRAFFADDEPITFDTVLIVRGVSHDVAVNFHVLVKITLGITCHRVRFIAYRFMVRRKDRKSVV